MSLSYILWTFCQTVYHSVLYYTLHYTYLYLFVCLFSMLINSLLTVSAHHCNRSGLLSWFHQWWLFWEEKASVEANTTDMSRMLHALLHTIHSHCFFMTLLTSVCLIYMLRYTLGLYYYASFFKKAHNCKPNSENGIRSWWQWHHWLARFWCCHQSSVLGLWNVLLQAWMFFREKTKQNTMGTNLGDQITWKVQHPIGVVYGIISSINHNLTTYTSVQEYRWFWSQL